MGAGVGEACQNLPQDCETPPGLAEVIEAWDDLPEAIRAGILAMVKASTVEAFR